jgi:hypothetical protein
MLLESPHEDTPGRSAARYELTIAPRALTLVLLVVALTLLACHAALSIYHYRVHAVSWLLRQLFDVDQENNVPTWYSDFLLLTAWALLWRKKKVDGDPWCRYWRVLAVGFLLMAIDEIAGVHETINSAIAMSWTIPAGIMVLVLGIAFVPFLLHLPRRTALWFAVSGAVYVAGAVGIEGTVGSTLVGQDLQDTLAYCMSTLVEEGMEMLGVIMFISALLQYMRGPGEGPVRASVDLS